MQVQENNGHYRAPEPLKPEKLAELASNRKVKRVLIFAAYDQDGKPTPELRRAWKRANRTKR